MKCHFHIIFSGFSFHINQTKLIDAKSFNKNDSRKHRGCFYSQGALEHPLTSEMYSFFLGRSSGVGYVVEWFVKCQCFQIENTVENIEFNVL